MLSSCPNLTSSEPSLVRTSSNKSNEVFSTRSLWPLLNNPRLFSLLLSTSLFSLSCIFLSHFSLFHFFISCFSFFFCFGRFVLSPFCHNSKTSGKNHLGKTEKHITLHGQNTISKYKGKHELGDRDSNFRKSEDSDTWTKVTTLRKRTKESITGNTLIRPNHEAPSSE